MEKSDYTYSLNNDWGWFVDIEDSLTKSYKPPKFKYYSYKKTLPTIKELSRNKSINKLSELYSPGDDDDEPKKRKSFKFICYIVIFVIIIFYLL